MLAPDQQPFSASQPHNALMAHGNNHHSDASYVPLIVVLVVITCLSVFACVLSRVCSSQRNDEEEELCDLEKGLGTAKPDAARLKNKDAASFLSRPNMMTASKCELHGNVINPKKLISAKTAATATLKKQGFGRCELHGVYLSRNTKLSDISGANGEDRSSVNSN